MMNRSFEYRCALLIAAGTAWAACGVPGTARAAPLSSVEFTRLAARCAPSVPPEILATVARTESDLDPWALHDNTTGVTEQPTTLQAARSDAWRWIDRGDSVDVGLMQINSANFSALDLTADSALAPCASLAGGAAVLQAAYGGGKTSADQQAALLMALSRYNTGSPFKGIMNGYARKVIANADAGQLPAPVGASEAAQPIDPNAPPSWNIWATAAYVRTHGAPWLIPLTPPASEKVSSAKLSAGQPTVVAPAAMLVASTEANSSPQPNQRSP